MKGNTERCELPLDLPDSILDDLQKIAAFNGVSVRDLTYSYIVDGIAGDSRVLKRAEFTRQVKGILRRDDFLSRDPKDIINDFNLLY